jgi:hypothetical protein
MSMSSSMSLWGGDIITLGFFLGHAWLPGRCQWRPSTTGCSGSHPSAMTGVLTNHGRQVATATAKLRPRAPSCNHEREIATASAKLQPRAPRCDGNGSGCQGQAAVHIVFHIRVTIYVFVYSQYLMAVLKDLIGQLRMLWPPQLSH